MKSSGAVNEVELFLQPHESKLVFKAMKPAELTSIPKHVTIKIGRIRSEPLTINCLHTHSIHSSLFSSLLWKQQQQQHILFVVIIII